MRQARIKRVLRKLVAKAYFSLPGNASLNPKKNIRTIPDVCRLADKDTIDHNLQDRYATLVGSSNTARVPPTVLKPSDLEHFNLYISQHQQPPLYSFPEVHLALLHEAFVHTTDLFVFTSKRVLLQESIPSERALRESGILETVVWPPTVRIKEKHFLLSTAWSNSYYHWLFDALPRLSLLEATGISESLKLAVDRRVPSKSLESLACLGIGEDRLTRLPSSAVQFENLYFSGLLAPTGNPAPTSVSWLRHKFLPLVNPERNQPPRRRLYVSRRDAAGRRVKNEHELVAMLETFGFETICPGEMTFTEQISAFSEATLIIGPHGAGLSNSVFSPPGSTVIELFGDDYGNGCFWALSNLCGHRHALMFCPSDGRDFTAPLHEARQLLSKFVD